MQNAVAFPLQNFLYQWQALYDFSRFLTAARICTVFEKWNIQAAISLPIEINGEAAMYLCFFELRKRRIWDVSDIKF